MSAVEEAMQAFCPGLPLLVALSGGGDSSALLLACQRRWSGQVVAVHVNHGLLECAPAFERHCVDFCARLAVPLHICRLSVLPKRGESVEAVARQARYRALSQAARDHQARDIALAHSADDQVETVLLALSRGAGLAGLSGMPAQAVKDGIAYHRPLLHVPGAQLRQWLLAQGQDWIEDPSNDNPRFLRNRIRSRLLPVLSELFPSFRVTFARSAAHAARAQQVITALAEQDLLMTGEPPHIALLQTLPPQRQANALRQWLAKSSGGTPTSAQLHQLQEQIACCTTKGHRLHLVVAGGLIERQGAKLQWTPTH